jgi:hypothetical protein
VNFSQNFLIFTIFSSFFPISISSTFHFTIFQVLYPRMSSSTLTHEELTIQQCERNCNILGSFLSLRFNVIDIHHSSTSSSSSLLGEIKAFFSLALRLPHPRRHFVFNLFFLSLSLSHLISNFFYISFSRNCITRMEMVPRIIDFHCHSRRRCPARRANLLHMQSELKEE